MSTTPDTEHSGCCGGSAKPASQQAQRPTQTAPADAKAQESATLTPPKPTAPQPKSKSCCG